MTLNVLIAEDAGDVAKAVAFGVRMAWPDCHVTIAADGAEALRRFGEHQPDIVILDVEMPPPDGFAVCQHIRARSDVPILMLTVRDDTVDKVRALDMGADDYLTKPFDPLELLARLRALLRRTHAPVAPSTPTLTLGDIALDPNAHTVQVRGQVVRLTATEYRLLDVLMRHAGTVLSHQFLLEQAWGPEYVGDTQYLKVFVRRLRQKLGDDVEHPRYIQTEWGVGYRFALPY